MNLKFLNDDSIFLKPIGWPKLKKKIDKLLERNAKFIEKVECQKLRAAAKDQAEELTSINNSRDVPGNATTRKEYVKCGKPNCLRMHGPYYYAYWKDNDGKLCKKYIGKPIHYSTGIKCTLIT